MTSVIVKVEIGEDNRCGNCRFYDDEGYRCVLFDKSLQTECVPENRPYAYRKPIRCAECEQAEVEDDETVC